MLDNKLHIYCNFGHNLFKPCMSAKPIFLLRFDTIIRFLISGSNVEGSMQHLTTWGTQSGWGMGLCGGGWWVGCGGWGLLGGSFGPCPLRPSGTYRRRQTTNIIKPSRTFRNSYDATPEIFEAPYDIRFHSVCWFPLIDPIMGYNITEIYDDTSSGIFFHPIGHSACWFLLWMTRVPQDPLRPGRTRR